MSEKVELGMGRGQGKLLGDQGRRWRHILEGTGGGGVGRSAVLQTDLRKLWGEGGLEEGDSGVWGRRVGQKKDVVVVEGRDGWSALY